MSAPRASVPMLLGTAVIAMFAAVFATVQAVLVLGVHSSVLRDAGSTTVVELLLRAGINIVSAVVLVGLVFVLCPERRRRGRQRLLIVAIALVGTLVRAGLQVIAGVSTVGDPAGRSAVATEGLTTFCMAVLAVAAGLFTDRLWRRARHADRDRLRGQQRINELLRELQHEELRVRQEIAHTIHGSVQGLFVVLEARLHAISEELSAAPVALTTARELTEVRRSLARLREGELREMSGRLYPVDLERGLTAAMTTLLARLPSTVSCDARYESALAEIERREPEPAAQVLLLRVVEEALVNALRHADPRSIRLRLFHRDEWVDIVVENDGAPDDDPGRRSGIGRLARQLELFDGEVRFARSSGRAELRASMRLRGVGADARA